MIPEQAQISDLLRPLLECQRVEWRGGGKISKIRALQYPSVKGVTTVDQDIGTCHEGGGIGAKEDGQSVEVVDCSKAVLWSQRLPDDLLCVQGWNVVQCCVHVTWGDAVYTNVVLGPLSSEGLSELDDSGLGCIVAGLLLWVVDDGSGHRGNEDDGTWLASLNHGLANSLCDHERSVEVDVDQSAEHGVVVSLGWNVGAEQC